MSDTEKQLSNSALELIYYLTETRNKKVSN